MLAHHNEPAGASVPASRPQVGLTWHQEQRLKRQLRDAAPSEPWVEAQIKTAGDVDGEGQPIVYRYHDPHVFPPGGEQTGMVRCPQCGVFTPPNAFETGACLDHADHRNWGPSPSAVAIRALQFFNLRLEEAELPPEDDSSLRREIKKFFKNSSRTPKK